MFDCCETYGKPKSIHIGTVYVFGKSDKLKEKYLKRRRTPGRVKKQIRRLAASEGPKIQTMYFNSLPQVIGKIKELFFETT